MAIERLFGSIKQDILLRASNLSDEASQLFKSGRRDEAEAKMGEVRAEIARTKKVDQILPDILKKLQAAGIDQPSVEYLSEIVARYFEELEKKPTPQGQEGTVSSTRRKPEMPKPRLVAGETGLAAKINLEEKSVTVGGKTINFRGKEWELLNALNQQPREWFTSNQLCDELGFDTTLKLTQTMHRLKKKLGESANDLIKSEGKGKGGARHMLSLLKEDGVPEEPKREEGEGKPKFTKETGFTLIPDEKAVIIGENRIGLSKQELDLLIILNKEAGRWVDRGVIAERLFGSADKLTSLHQLVSRLRNKLGESRKDPKFIRSSGKGKEGGKYMLNIEVEQIASSEGVKADAEEKSNETVAGDFRLLDGQIYLLAQSITNQDERTLDKLGVKLNPDDRARISSILERIGSTSVPAQNPNELREDLTSKLLAYTQNPDSVFSGNEGNDDAEFLLTVLSGLESKDEVEELLQTQKPPDLPVS